MGHTLIGSGKIYQVYSLTYDISFLNLQIDFEVRFTLENNNKNRPPSILTPLIEQRLTKGRGKARPKELTPRHCEFCYQDGQVNSTYIPYSENKSEFLKVVKDFISSEFKIESISYNSEKWTSGIEERI